MDDLEKVRSERGGGIDLGEEEKWPNISLILNGINRNVQECLLAEAVS